MESEFYIALLNPSIALVLATVFLVLWLYRRLRTDLLVLAFGYCAVSAGFLTRHFFLPTGADLVRVLSNFLFLFGAACIAGGTIMHYNRKVPVVGLCLLVTGGILAFSWSLFIQPDITWRLLFVNFALGGILLLAALELRAVANKTIVDKTLLVVLVGTSLNFFVRTLFVVHLEGPYESDASFQHSLYWATITLSHNLLSMVTALCLIASSAIRLIEDLQIEAQHDQLSGLLNRRGFEGRATGVVADHGHQPVALVLCDLDHFKNVNDTYGHAGGDVVLATFARHLRTTAPRGSVLGRIGGEEFAILLPTTGVMAARLYAEGLRASLASVVVEGLPEDLRVTASFGVAAQTPGEPLTSLMRRADDALYRAKRSGRDRVRLSTHDMNGVVKDWLARAASR